MSGDYEIIEHTADVGIRARGGTLGELFEQATLGLLDISDARRPGAGETVPIEVEAPDVEALLVDWLGEVLYLQEVRDAVVGEVAIDDIEATKARGTITLASRDETLEGTAVKAITYHQLYVREGEGGFEAQVFVDV